MDELELGRLQVHQRHLLLFSGLLMASITAVFVMFAIAINSSGKLATTKITMQTAENIALAKEPGKILSSELENEEGKLVYSFDINHDGVVHEVSVDADAGTMVDDIAEGPSSEYNQRHP